VALLVLVADDDADVRLMLRLLLNKAGMRVLEAGSGAETLEVLAKQDPDVVLLDWRMPTGGLPLARKLVEELGLRNRVIMLSGLADPRDRHSALQAGIARYFVKPANPDVLIAAIRELAHARLKPLRW
jgi:two-component system phosphate regulon response regulator PhoB